MPEFSCFITAKDYADILATARADGFRLCLKKTLSAPKHEYVAEADDIPALLKNKQNSFLLERNDFTRCSVALRAVTRNGQRLWFPLTNEGGPVIETYFFPPYEKDGQRVIPCSLIAYGGKFFNPMTERQESAGSSIKNAYHTIVAPLQKRFRLVHSAQRKRRAYVSRGIDDMLEVGWTLAQPFRGSLS
jgi:hypothetical protein